MIENTIIESLGIKKGERMQEISCRLITLQAPEQENLIVLGAKDQARRPVAIFWAMATAEDHEKEIAYLTDATPESIVADIVAITGKSTLPEDVKFLYATEDWKETVAAVFAQGKDMVVDYLNVPRSEVEEFCKSLG